MAIVNGYCSLAQVRAELGSYAGSDTSDDTRLEIAVAAASRQIDAYCGRRFWQDGTVVDREYDPEDAFCIRTDDISTTTGLVVKTDTGLDGAYSTTLALNTDFALKPQNAADEVPVRPFTEIRIISTSSSNAYFPMWKTGRPTVRVTAKYGWPAVPDDVLRACLIQSVQLFKASDAVFGVLQMGDGFATRVRSSLNPLAEALLDAYRKPPVG